MNPSFFRFLFMLIKVTTSRCNTFHCCIQLQGDGMTEHVGLNLILLLHLGHQRSSKVSFLYHPNPSILQVLDPKGCILTWPFWIFGCGMLVFTKKKWKDFHQFQGSQVVFACFSGSFPWTPKKTSADLENCVWVPLFDLLGEKFHRNHPPDTPELGTKRLQDWEGLWNLKRAMGFWGPRFGDPGVTLTTRWKPTFSGGWFSPSIREYNIWNINC